MHHVSIVRKVFLCVVRPKPEGVACVSISGEADAASCSKVLGAVVLPTCRKLLGRRHRPKQACSGICGGLAEKGGEEGGSQGIREDESYI